MAQAFVLEEIALQSLAFYANVLNYWSMLRWNMFLVVFCVFLPSVQAAGDLSKLLNQKRFIDAEGNSLSLKELAAGTPMVVVVLKSAACVVCQGQLQSLVKRKIEFNHLGSKIAAIVQDDKALLEKLRDPDALPFSILHESTPRTLKELGFWRGSNELLPGYFFLDRCGRFAGKVLGRRPGFLEDKSIIERLKEIRSRSVDCGFIS
tara:strand:+ start:123 stop:740 length:618 start_codon:yes stop_codon:yes gene_type:complete